VPWILGGKTSLTVYCGVGRMQQLNDWIQRFTILEDLNCSPQPEHYLLEQAPDVLPASGSGDPSLDELQRGLEPGFRLAGELAYAQYCAEQLQLRPGLDLDERFNPLEAGLRRWVSFDKGCYVGQEVVARLENYDKVRRRPALVHGPTPLARQAQLRREDRRGAQVVHSAPRLDEDGAYALVLLEREWQEGAVLQQEDGAEWVVENASEI